MFYPKFDLFWEATGDIYRTIPTMMKLVIRGQIDRGHKRSLRSRESVRVRYPFYFDRNSIKISIGR